METHDKEEAGDGQGTPGGDIDDLPPPLPEPETEAGAAGAAAPPAVPRLPALALAVPLALAPFPAGAPPDGATDARALLERVHALQAGQHHQTHLLQELRTTVHALTVANAGLTAAVAALGRAPPLPRDGPPRRDPAAKKYASKKDAVLKEAAAAVAVVARKVLSEAGPGQTPNEEIEGIIAARRMKGGWPVRQGTVKGFSQDEDLIKVRFHHSEQFQHIPVRIPKTEKNKDGTKPCKLCSDGKVRRKTTWMCAVCEVPLCTRPLMDEDGSCLTHHTRWHSARDLIQEHARCHADLKTGRASRKRAKEGSELAGDVCPPALKKARAEGAEEEGMAAVAAAMEEGAGEEAPDAGAGEEMRAIKEEEEDAGQAVAV